MNPLKNAAEEPAVEETAAELEQERGKTLARAILELPYVPDFLLEETRFWFVPSRESPLQVYHTLVGESAKTWESYYTKRGWSFLHELPRPGEGPYSVPPSGIRISILEPGRIFAPKPMFLFEEGGARIPIVSLEKRRPINPWKPNYIQALNFIKKYEWPYSLPRAVSYAIWEIEECGQVAGSTSWRNAERILEDSNSEELRKTLADVFFHRPEDYPLGSEVYLRVLGCAGEEGFRNLRELASHPVSRKRKIVAVTLGKLKNPEGLPTLLELLEDEDPEVRRQALRSIGKVGIDPQSGSAAKVAAYLESKEISERVWAAQALLKGGDESQHKYIVQLVKEEPRLLTDMGELGDVIADLGLAETVPFLINRLKHPKSEFRADAAEALERVTGIKLDYQSLDTEEQRRNAIKTCSRWWEDRKSERKKARSQ